MACSRPASRWSELGHLGEEGGREGVSEGGREGEREGEGGRVGEGRRRIGKDIKQIIHTCDYRRYLYCPRVMFS